MKNLTVFFATRLRGFFRKLSESEKIKFHIEASNNKIYETNSKFHGLKARLVRSKLADWLGLIQRIKVAHKSENIIIGSYNRFLNASNPYFIYVENPTALYHYTLGRAKSYFGKLHIRQLMNDPSLKGLVFMCKACETTFEQLVGKINNTILHTQIYPLIPTNPLCKPNEWSENLESRELQFIYIAQGKRFKSKGGLEIIQAFKALNKKYNNIRLSIVTNIEMLESNILEDIKSCRSIILKDFRLSPSEMNLLYSKSDVLLQPTSDDSCSLTILEALHSGLAIIASSLYSIPEIVTNEENGFLMEPHYWFFSKDSNLPNPKVWNNRKKTIYSGKISKRLTNDIMNRMEILIKDRKLLLKMRLDSWNKSHNPPFSEEYIASQWNDFIDNISTAKSVGKTDYSNFDVVIS